MVANRNRLFGANLSIYFIIIIILTKIPLIFSRISSIIFYLLLTNVIMRMLSTDQIDNTYLTHNTHTHTYTHTYTHMYTHTHIHMHTHVHTHIHTNTHTQSHTHTHTHIHTYTHTHTYIHTYTHTHTHTYTHTHTNTHTHTHMIHNRCPRIGRKMKPVSMVTR